MKVKKERRADVGEKRGWGERRGTGRRGEWGNCCWGGMHERRKIK